MKSNILAIRLQEAFNKFAGNFAIRNDKSEISYTDLHRSALIVSRNIVEAGKGLSEPVAILGSKSFFTYAGICGALFSSRAYMPLNLKFPLARNLKMLQLSEAKIIVADAEAADMLDQLLSASKGQYTIILEDLPGDRVKKYPQHTFLHSVGEPETELQEITASADDIAYLLFTSGTTGTPKGVPVSNLNVTSYLEYVLEEWDFREDDNFSHTFDLTFDLSVHDMMVCWLSGACLCIPEEDTALKMAAYIRKHDITVWFSVPSMAILMNKMRLLKAKAITGLRLSFFCGEPLPAMIAENWKKAVGDRKVINLYGPSEATIAISAYTWENETGKSINDIVSIGRMFFGQEHCLLDPDTMQVCETKGELCLGGTQIIAGYLHDEELSNKYFIELDGKAGKTWYRTGDFVEQDKEGELFFLGRTDSEVKISGYRVNLFEIDALVRKFAGTEQVATILDETGTSRILTFAGADSRIDEKEIIRHCREELPWYMIPEVIIFVDEMPLNVNGKIDRSKLKQMLHE